MTNNKLELNRETVRDAIEYWLNHIVFKNDVHVVAVTDGINTISLTVEYQNKDKENDDAS